jgi:hypothetical protein
MEPAPPWQYRPPLWGALPEAEEHCKNPNASGQTVAVNARGWGCVALRESRFRRDQCPAERNSSRTRGSN